LKAIGSNSKLPEEFTLEMGTTGMEVIREEFKPKQERTLLLGALTVRYPVCM